MVSVSNYFLVSRSDPLYIWII